MSDGTYEESLPCGGRLKVTKSAWQISYYFAGPDMRYNGTFVTVPGEAIEEYISAFEENWEKYEKLKESIPEGGDFSTHGVQGMTIRIGNFAEGVCIRSYHMPISSWEQLQKVIGGYRYAEQKGPKLQEVLASL